MILTLSFLYSKFDEFNKRFFNDELPKITININKTKHRFGAFVYRKIRGEVKPVCITISKYYEQPEIEYCNTLIHEMIHYYIGIKKLAPWYEDSHGETFQRMMHEINQNSEFKIGILKYLENRVLSNKNKEFRVLLYEYQGSRYFCRVSPTMTMKKAEEKYKGLISRNIVKLIKVYSTKNPKVDNMKLYIKKLGMTKFTDNHIAEYELKEVA